MARKERRRRLSGSSARPVEHWVDGRPVSCGSQIPIFYGPECICKHMSIQIHDFSSSKMAF
jgi:hypothetical protein